MGFKWMRDGRKLSSIRQWAGQQHQLFLHVYTVVGGLAVLLSKLLILFGGQGCTVYLEQLRSSVPSTPASQVLKLTQ